jgi:hypothetical protein
MVRWQELNLPSGFRPAAPSAIGVQTGAAAVSVAVGEERLDTTIEGSFVFTDEARGELLFGYTVVLESAQDRNNFDVLLGSFPDFVAAGGASQVKGITLTDLPPSVASHAAVSETRTLGGNVYYTERAVFRIDDVGGSVFVRLPAGVEPTVRIATLAQVYAQSILKANRPCQIMSVAQLDPLEWPSFHVLAEGFYPFETRSVTLVSQVQVGETVSSFISALAGLSQDAQTADAAGSIDAEIAFGPVSGAIPLSPQEFTLTVIGQASGCEAAATVPWTSP